MYTTMSLALSILACGSPDTGKETDRSRHSEGASDHDAIDTGDDHDTGEGSAHDDDTGHVPSPSVDVTVVVVEVSDDADWRDLSFLAAIPASAHLNGGMPAVVAISVEGLLRLGPGTSSRDSTLRRWCTRSGWISRPKRSEYR